MKYSKKPIENIERDRNKIYFSIFIVLLEFNKINLEW